MIAFALPYLLRVLPVLALLAALAGAGWWAYATGSDAGRAAVQAKWDAEKTAAAEARATELRETAKRMDVLHIEVERLRARPARIKTITETIHVQADADCRSLPADLRRLWDAADGGADGPPAASARVDDAGVPAVAGDGR
jgi:hypothetical protein